MPETGYGSDEFSNAGRVDAACRVIVGGGARARLEKLRAGSRSLARYERSLALTPLPLTGTPAGRIIAEHFSIREEGRLRYRSAQGVLLLPDDFADYMRGRSRQ